MPNFNNWWMKACVVAPLAIGGWAQALSPGADQLYRDATAAVREGDFKQGEFWLREMRERYPQDERWGTALMEALTSQGRTREAEELSREVRQKFGATPAFQVQLGILYVRMEQPDRALQQFEAVVARNESSYYSYYAWTWIGTVRRGQGRIDDAIAAFRNAKEITGSPSFELAMALGDKGEFDEAIAEYRALMAINRNATVLNNLAYTLAEKGEHLGEAEELSMESTSSVPGASSMTDTLGWIYYKQGRFEEAEQVLLHATEQEGGLRDILREHLAAVMDARGLWTGDRREARELLTGELDAKQVRRLKELLQAMME